MLLGCRCGEDAVFTEGSVHGQFYFSREFVGFVGMVPGMAGCELHSMLKIFQ